MLQGRSSDLDHAGAGKRAKNPNLSFGRLLERESGRVPEWGLKNRRRGIRNLRALKASGKGKGKGAEGNEEDDEVNGAVSSNGSREIKSRARMKCLNLNRAGS